MSPKVNNNANVDPNDRPSKGKPTRRVRTSNAVADWASVDPAILLKAVATVSASGGALRLGYTGDGGAYAIGVYGDGDPYNDYVKPADDIDAYLKSLAEAWE